MNMVHVLILYLCACVHVLSHTCTCIYQYGAQNKRQFPLDIPLVIRCLFTESLSKGRCYAQADVMLRMEREWKNSKDPVGDRTQDLLIAMQCMYKYSLYMYIHIDR